MASNKKVIYLIVAALLCASCVAWAASHQSAAASGSAQPGLSNMSSVVVVQTLGMFPSAGLPPFVGRGFGFVVDGSGHILTANHVVEGVKSITVKLSDGTVRKAIVLKSDEGLDAAVLKVEKRGLRPVTLGDSSKLEPGALASWVYQTKEHGGDFSRGTVAAVDVKVHTLRTDVLELSGILTPGSSGGPVFGPSGTVVGMVVAMMSPPPDKGEASGEASRSGTDPARVFAMPIDSLKPLIESAATKRR